MQQLNYYPPQDELDEELTIDLKKILYIIKECNAKRVV